MVRAKQTYRPYGAVYAAHQEGALPTDYEFTGQRHEEPGDLYQMGARWYDPYLNRWVQPDTIVPEPENPQTLNRYAYVANSPLKYTDPTGHDLFIVEGWTNEGDYDDPDKWLEWIEAYVGEEKAAEWYEEWKAAKSPEARRETAQKYGIAVFNWNWKGGVGGSWATDNTQEAAMQVQKQVNALGLKDVTLIGHSKGALVLDNYLNDVAKGWIDKGQVKNLVLIDPPSGIIGTGIFDANPGYKGPLPSGMHAAVLPGHFACLFRAPCSGPVSNAWALPYVDSHEIRSEEAITIFYGLRVKGDAHADPIPPTWTRERGR